MEADPPPETNRIRLVRIGAICMSPMFVAEDLLWAEGFSDVQYAKHDTLGTVEQALANGEMDVALTYALRLAQRLDADAPLVGLAGVHTGCVELFGSDGVRSMRDLKGKRVAAGRAATGLPGLLEIIRGPVGLATRIPITAGQSEITSHGVRRLLDAGAVDLVNVDASECGGVTEWRRAAALCALAGVRMAHHEESQIAQHLLAGVPHGTYLECFADPERDPVWQAVWANRHRRTE